MCLCSIYIYKHIHYIYIYTCLNTLCMVPGDLIMFLPAYQSSFRVSEGPPGEPPGHLLFASQLRYNTPYPDAPWCSQSYPHVP